jgi:hypothetical protein
LLIIEKSKNNEYTQFEANLGTFEL